MSRSSAEGVSPFSSFRSLRTGSAVAAILLLGVAWYVYRSFTPFALLPVGSAVGFGVYAAFGRRHVGSSMSPLEDPRLPGVLTTAFLFAIAGALFSLRNAYYTKPVTFYAAVAVAAGVLVARILLTDANLTNGLLAFVFGLTTFVTNQLAFPLGLNGPDSGLHRRFARQVYRTGLVPGVGGTESMSTQYVGYPLQHVLSASSAHVTGLPVGPTYRAVAIAGMILVLPLTYLIARRFGAREFALLAVVVVASMEYVVYRAGHPSKMAYALPLLMFTFTCVIYVHRRRGTPESVPLFGVFCLALVFTHAHTAFVALILLVSLAIAVRLVPFVDPPLARLFGLGGTLRSDGSGAAGGSEGSPPPSGRVENVAGIPGGSRLHVLTVAFVVAFLAQAVYFSGFYGDIVEILRRWIEAVVLATVEDTTREAPRFAQLPLASILINTVGSGLLASFVVLGILDRLERRVRFGLVLLAWLIVASGVMAIGVVGDAQFALPNRVYVIAQLTAMSLFAAAGLGYLSDRAPATTSGTGRVVLLCLVVVVAGFVFFSTASTIAGPGTSPFNDDVPHRMWTGMVEQDAADTFVDGRIAEERYRAASSFPIDEDGGIDYRTAESGTVVYVNEFRLSSGVTLQGGPGRIGGAVYVIPQSPRDGLAGTGNRIYDNGAVEFYQVRGDRTGAGEDADATESRVTPAPAGGWAVGS